jgi:hypothetical protein
VIHSHRFIGYFQEDQFIGFVEEAGAEEIVGLAKDGRYVVEDFGDWFNVVYKPIQKVVASKGRNSTKTSDCG